MHIDVDHLVVTFYPFSSFGWSPLHGLETRRYHYIEAPRLRAATVDTICSRGTHMRFNAEANDLYLEGRYF
jgi:hypothetical protein